MVDYGELELAQVIDLKGLAWKGPDTEHLVKDIKIRRM